LLKTLEVPDASSLKADRLKEYAAGRCTRPGQPKIAQYADECQLGLLSLQPLRTLSVDQLSDLMHQALQVLTVDNVTGSLRLADGSIISMRQCIDEFATYSKTREGAAIRRRLKEKLNKLHDIAEVKKFKNLNQDDDIDAFFDDGLSGDGILDFGDGPSSSIERKLHTTVAGATVGKKQVRLADKRLGGQRGY